MKSVLFVTREMRAYRVGLHLAIRNVLLERDVDYRVAFGGEMPRGDSPDDPRFKDWMQHTRVRRIGKGFLWQPVVGAARGSDLTIIGQENKLLVNHVLMAMRAATGLRLAYFGHGKNFQAPEQTGLAARLKTFTTRQVDWWFAYTERSADIVAATGFPRDRITVVQNSIDTAAIARERAAITASEQEQLRRELVDGSDNVAIFIGSIYGLKRLDFLIEAGTRVARAVPDFRLIIIGEAEGDDDLTRAVREQPWIRLMGAKLGLEKTRLASLAKVLLMPGLVGLVALDSLAYGLPLITTDVPYHSPEIDYLTPGVDSVMVRPHDDADAYAAAVIRTLSDDPYREALRAAGARKIAAFSTEAMASRFADGITRALER